MKKIFKYLLLYLYIVSVNYNDRFANNDHNLVSIENLDSDGCLNCSEVKTNDCSNNMNYIVQFDNNSCTSCQQNIQSAQIVDECDPGLRSALSNQKVTNNFFIIKNRENKFNSLYGCGSRYKTKSCGGFQYLRKPFLMSNNYNNCAM